MSGQVSSAAITAVTVIAAALAAGCAAPAVPSATPVFPPSNSCVSSRNVDSEAPLTSTPAATGFSATPVPLPTYLRTGGDTITGGQAILNFPVAAQVVAPDQAVVLTSFTVNTTDPAGWALNRSFDAVAFSNPDGGQMTQQSCPSHDTGVLAAMRAAGHQPLPERIEPGQTATGWVAFLVPRATTAINLWMRHLDSDGGYAGAESPLLHTNPR